MGSVTLGRIAPLKHHHHSWATSRTVVALVLLLLCCGPPGALSSIPQDKVLTVGANPLDYVSFATARAAFDLQCPREQVGLELLAAFRYPSGYMAPNWVKQVVVLARGCHRAARYACTNTTTDEQDSFACVREPEDPPASPGSSPSAPASSADGGTGAH
jgi:hypothetical protein